MQPKKPSQGQSKSASELVRLSKLMTEQGLCSRREADAYIQQGLVFVNGERISELGFKVTRDVKVELAAKAKQKQNELVTVILNKPIGYVSSQPEPGYEPAIRLLTEENFEGPQKPPVIPQKMRTLAVAGRLDIDSQGLLLFTEDGRLAKKIIGENSEIEKEYLVRVQGDLPKDQLKLLCHGLELDGKKLKPAKVEWVNEDQLRFVLVEGRKRQVRRMCELVGLQVKGLKRVRIGKLRLGHLPEGRWRFLLSGEEI
ncbi:MAG: pseudouridine synthase [Pseudobdellovibrionaceae bacterium]